MAAFFGVYAGEGSRCIDKGEHRQFEFFSGFHQAQRFAVTLGAGHAEIARGALFGVTPFLLTQHHAGIAVETRQATDDAQVIRKMPVAVHFDKVGEDVADVVQRVRALGVAGDLGDLPGRQIAVNVFGQLLALFGQLLNFFRNIDRRLDLHVTQFFNLGFKFGNRLLEVEESFLGQSFLLVRGRSAHGCQ